MTSMTFVLTFLSKPLESVSPIATRSGTPSYAAGPPPVGQRWPLAVDDAFKLSDEICLLVALVDIWIYSTSREQNFDDSFISQLNCFPKR